MNSYSREARSLREIRALVARSRTSSRASSVSSAASGADRTRDILPSERTREMKARDPAEKRRKGAVRNAQVYGADFANEADNNGGDVLASGKLGGISIDISDGPGESFTHESSSNKLMGNSRRTLELRATTDKCKFELERLQKQYAESTVRITSLERLLYDSEQRCTAVQRNFSAVSRRVKELLDETSNLKQKVDSERDAKRRCREELDLVQSKGFSKEAIDAMKEEKVRLDAELAHTKKMLAESRSRAGNLESTMTTQDKEILSLRQEIANIRRDDADQRSRLLATEKDLRSRLDAAEASERNALAGMEHAERAANKIHAKVVEIENERDAQQAEIEELNEKITNLHEDRAQMVEALHQANLRCQTTLSAVKGQFESRVSEERDKLKRRAEADTVEARAAIERTTVLERRVAELEDEIKETVRRAERIAANAKLDTRELLERERLTLRSEYEERRMAVEEQARTAAELAEESRRRHDEEIAALRAEMEKEREDLRDGFERRLDAVRTKEAELDAAIAKLGISADAVESLLTCMHCAETFDHPVMLIPCGHHYCQMCAIELEGSAEMKDDTGNKKDDGDRTSRWCPECQGHTAITETSPNVLLGSIVSKFVYMKQTLASLRGMVQGNEDEDMDSDGEGDDAYDNNDNPPITATPAAAAATPDENNDDNDNNNNNNNNNNNDNNDDNEGFNDESYDPNGDDEAIVDEELGNLWLDDNDKMKN